MLTVLLLAGQPFDVTLLQPNATFGCVHNQIGAILAFFVLVEFSVSKARAAERSARRARGLGTARARAAMAARERAHALPACLMPLLCPRPSLVRSVRLSRVRAHIVSAWAGCRPPRPCCLFALPRPVSPARPRAQILELLLHLVIYPRVLPWLTGKPWRREPFPTAQKVINVIYFQALIWLCAPYFPYVALFAPFALLATFKFDELLLSKAMAKPSDPWAAEEVRQHRRAAAARRSL